MYNELMADDNTKLVYSTVHAVPRKGKSSKKHITTGAAPALQKVRVRLERKGRGGKSVTVIEGIQLAPDERTILLKKLKSKLGTGGTVRNTLIEIQGDQRDGVMAELEKLGYRPKRSGG